ncbi:MAG TPA: bifunctional metallophosphatase/5'-nucleotidase [Sphingomicrobium sp.]|nr:bifunctional metallophosphatase/5'-nucleotidase [Sphingomicrobium sp.]
MLKQVQHDGRIWVIGLALSLTACASVPAPSPAAAPALAAAPAQPQPVEVQILAINDFHGNLEAPRLSIEAGTPEASVRVPAGGVAHLAAAAKALRSGQAHSVTLSAGDMIGGSPLVSALFLDEPTIRAMDLVGVEYNAVGNHEFDKGWRELQRMQAGGCEAYTTKQPCKLEPFPGARFKFLAANVIMPGGGTLFPGTAIKDFGPVQLGIVGMTLTETKTLVTPSGVEGLTFADEAATANAAVPALKAAGADAIVLLIHQGGNSSGGYNGCADLSGEIMPIIDKLDPAIDLVISGHTHQSYICEVSRPGRERPLLLTSASSLGRLITDIRLTFAPDGTLQGQRAQNVIVQGEGYSLGGTTVAPVASFPIFSADPEVKALVDRYVAAAKPEAARVVGTLTGTATKQENDAREHSAGLLVADAQLAAGRKYGAVAAFMNTGGVRTDLVPAADGSITFGQVFAVQPFGNSIVVKTLTGAQLKTLLEQQFQAERPKMLMPSRGFFFSYDLSRPYGNRIVDMRLNGRRIDPKARYRIAINNFLASGGDGFAILAEGTDPADAGLDTDALEALLKAGAKVPELGRIRNLGPKPAS